MACCRGHLSAARALLAHPLVDPNLADGLGVSPLLAAVLADHTRVVATLLQHGDTDLTKQDREGHTPLSLGNRSAHQPTMAHTKHMYP